MSNWNRCDECGQFYSFEDIGAGAIRRLITPDSEFSKEEYETLCKDCAKDDRTVESCRDVFNNHRNFIKVFDPEHSERNCNPMRQPKSTLPE